MQRKLKFPLDTKPLRNVETWGIDISLERLIDSWVAIVIGEEKTVVRQ